MENIKHIEEIIVNTSTNKDINNLSHIAISNNYIFGGCDTNVLIYDKMNYKLLKKVETKCSIEMMRLHNKYLIIRGSTKLFIAEVKEGGFVKTFTYKS
jgi:hypothetical protein